MNIDWITYGIYLISVVTMCIYYEHKMRKYRNKPPEVPILMVDPEITALMHAILVSDDRGGLQFMSDLQRVYQNGVYNGMELFACALERRSSNYIMVYGELEDGVNVSNIDNPLILSRW